MSNSSIGTSKKDDSVLKYFFLGIVIVVIVQTIFMFGGMIIEKNMQIAITGIPSAIGLTLVLIIGLILSKRSTYILLGSFALAFISPLILSLIVVFKAMDFTVPHIYYSTTYLVLVILIVWLYYIVKILKNGI